MKLLVVEDEPTAGAFLQRGLREEGFAVDLAATADEANDCVAIYDYDAILLDVMIPGGNGFDLCRAWRSQGLSTPILFLTAREDISDRVRGLDTGGDDYLTKPFAFEELLARARALVRRGASGSSSTVLNFDPLRIDLAAKRVSRDGTEINLTAREFQLLEYFALHAGKLVTRTQLWEHVWETGSEPDSNVVDVYIRYLRDKLGRDPDFIRTQRGSGYIFMTAPD